MFCPKCGQQQTTDEIRFCSRCGLQLGVVSALVATGGVPPAIVVTNDQSSSRFSVKRRMRQGAKLMFASVVLTPLAIGFSILIDSPGPFIIPFTIFLAGLTWMLYSRLFGEDVSTADIKAPPTQLNGAQQLFLPATQSPFMAELNKQAHRTAEIVQPRSVTENTTRLFDGEEGTH